MEEIDAGNLPLGPMEPGEAPGDICPKAEVVVAFPRITLPDDRSLSQFIAGKIEYEHGFGHGEMSFYGICYPGRPEMRMPGQHNRIS